MTNGPIKRYKSHLSLAEAKRKKALEDATAPAKKEGPKNPYPAGSARAKYWARRQAEKTKMK